MPHLLPRMRLDLRKLELRIIGIHLPDLFPGRSAEHLDYLNELVDARVAGKYRLAEQKLGQHAARAPNVNLGRVVDGAEYELGRSVIMIIIVLHAEKHYFNCYQCQFLEMP